MSPSAVPQHPNNDQRLAIFPEAVLADPQSEYLRTLPVDIEWEDYGLNSYITRQLPNSARIKAEMG